MILPLVVIIAVLCNHATALTYSIAAANCNSSAVVIPVGTTPSTYTTLNLTAANYVDDMNCAYVLYAPGMTHSQRNSPCSIHAGRS